MTAFKFASVGLMFTAIAIAGCAEDPDVADIRKAHADYGIPEDMYDVRVAVVNDAILANHQHFTEGVPRTQSLNVDAFDFLVGHRIEDFPRLFAAAGSPIEIEHAELLYGMRISDWMRKMESEHSPSKVDFFVLFTKIGLTFGFDAQSDFLVIAIADDTVAGWELYSITAY